MRALGIVESMDESPEYARSWAALCLPRQHPHGPFLHVDARGYPALVAVRPRHRSPSRPRGRVLKPRA
jgi:hypothetical protein